MRLVPVILAVAAGLIVAACGDNRPDSQAKAAADLKPREAIVGSWTIKTEESPEPYIRGYDFAADNTVKIHCSGAKEPIKAKYAFVNDYTMEVEYDATEEARKSYADAVKAYKEGSKEAAKKDSGIIGGGAAGAMAGMFARIPDQLPAKEMLTVIVKSVPSAGNQGGDKSSAEMILKNSQDFSLVYRKEGQTSP